jgi:hypothetical protein
MPPAPATRSADRGMLPWLDKQVETIGRAGVTLGRFSMTRYFPGGRSVGSSRPASWAT